MTQHYARMSIENSDRDTVQIIPLSLVGEVIQIELEIMSENNDTDPVIKIDLVKMTQDEFDALPEFQGY